LSIIEEDPILAKEISFLGKYPKLYYIAQDITF